MRRMMAAAARAAGQAFVALLLAGAPALAAPAFDMGEMRDAGSLELKVLSDWETVASTPPTRQKLVEITLFEIAQGRKIRLPVRYVVPVGTGPSNFIVCGGASRQGGVDHIAVRAPYLGGWQEALLEQGIGFVVPLMAPVKSMTSEGPALERDLGKLFRETGEFRYSTLFVWGASYMRAATAALTEPAVFKAEKIGAEGISKGGAAATLALINDDRFTGAFSRISAPSSAGPADPAEQAAALEANLALWRGMLDGSRSMGLEASVLAQLKDEARRHLEVDAKRLQGAGGRALRAAAAADEDGGAAGFSARFGQAIDIPPNLAQLAARGAEYFYVVGTSDRLTQSILDLGRDHPDFPLYILPNGKHGGVAEFLGQPDTNTRTAKATQESYVAFWLHHFTGAPPLMKPPALRHEREGDRLRIEARFAGTPVAATGELAFVVDRTPAVEGLSSPIMAELFILERWSVAPMTRTEDGVFAGEIAVPTGARYVDVVTVHEGQSNGRPVHITSPYTRIALD